jgi:hypothetical protein
MSEINDQDFLLLSEKYKELKETEKRLSTEIEARKEQLEHLKLLLDTDYEEQLKEAREQHSKELLNMTVKRDEYLKNKITTLFETSEITDISTTLKLIYKLKRLIHSSKEVEEEIPRIFINAKKKWLNLRCKYLADDVKKWTSFIRNDFYNFILHSKTIFSERAIPYLNELVPLYISQYVYTVIQNGLKNLKSAHDYNTLWTLLTLTDNALSQLGCPFLILLIPAIKESFINYISSLFYETKSIVDCVNEWRHFRPKFLEIPMQLLLKRISPQEHREFVESAAEVIISSKS